MDFVYITLWVAGVWILSTQNFGAFVGRQNLDEFRFWMNIETKNDFCVEKASALCAPIFKEFRKIVIY